MQLEGGHSRALGLPSSAPRSCLDTLPRRGGDPLREKGRGVFLSDYTVRSAGLKASDVVGAGNPCDRAFQHLNEEAVDPDVQERFLAALHTAEERRSGWGRRKPLAMLWALRAREPERAVVGGTEEECRVQRESALEALQVVWAGRRIAAEDRLELVEAIKHNRMADRKSSAAFHELNMRSYGPAMTSL